MLNKTPPYIMGIVNVTPDSFSDGGQYNRTDQAIEHGLNLVREGADILDIGGESTRPGAAPVTQQEELDRVLPVIEGLRGAGVPLSVDTRRAATMRAALKAGASIINDVTALLYDPESLNAVKDADYVCLMHMTGTPETMQVQPQYDDVVEEVLHFLLERVAVCERSGISREKLIIDPGIGFGKTLPHNLALLNNMGRFVDTGIAVMLGASRKSFIGAITGEQAAPNRVPGSISAALTSLQQNVQYFRVHDVMATKQAFEVYQAIRDSA